MRHNTCFFDAQDHELINLVNQFVQARAQKRATPHVDPSLHPHGIIEMATRHSLRIAHAVITLLDSLEAGGMQERLQALSRLHDEVLHTAHSSLRNNTGRVLIQLMKELVRSCPKEGCQLPLAHEFHRAVLGTPRIIRRLLHRYHLLEMPEAWNQQAFDHHVHDANTKGRKNPTHLVMDAWIKGIRFLTVVYYNYVDAEAAQELLEAARIMGITVRIGIEFRAAFQGRLVELTWSPLGCDDPKRFAALLADPAIAQIMNDYRQVTQWVRAHVLELLHAWNVRHAPLLAHQMGIPLPPPLIEQEFLTFVGQRQPSSLHLAEYIHQQLLPLLRQKDAALRAALDAAASPAQQMPLRAELDALEGLVPDIIRDTWLSPTANPDLVFPIAPHPSMPRVLLNPPETLLERLVPLHPCQMILNLSSLTAQDVLELLWRGKGRITHLELFNLREWAGGKLQHMEEINQLQRALNEGSAPRLKHIIRQIIAQERADAAEDSHVERDALFQDILSHIPTLQGYYAQSPLGSRIGTDSTSHSHHTHGMGLAFVETLPHQARRVLRHSQKDQRLALPITTDIYRFTQYHETRASSGRAMRLLRALPGMSHFGCHVVRGWALEKSTTRVEKPGNLVTLGGVDAKGISNDFEAHTRTQAPETDFPKLGYLNTNLTNTLKILAGFLPAQWAFYYAGSWWVLMFFGALLWFLITGLRNIIQSVVGGGGFNRSVLLPWKRYISWSRLADSLFYTGISVPLLEVVVRLWLLEDLLGLTVKNNALAVYGVIALVNSIYISGHNIFRGLPREAVIGNLFRSALSIPLSMLLGELLLRGFTFMELPDPLTLTQNCAAITAKCSSDTVAAVIEGFADRNLYLRLRQWDYASKFLQIYNNFVRQELLFPQLDMEDALNRPEKLLALLRAKDPEAARQAVANMLDMMYFWYYQPRARQEFLRKLKELSAEERAVLLGMQQLLTLEHEVSELFLQGLLGKNFARALAFYLQKNEDYLKELQRAVKR